MPGAPQYRRAMNICYIISGDLWGGAEEQSFSLIKDISASSEHDIHVITFNHGLLSEKLSLLDIPVYTVDESRNSALMIFLKILYFFKKKSFDVVHVHGFKENFLGGIAARVLNTKVILRTFHGRGLLSSPSVDFIEKFNCFFLTHKIITVSQELQTYLISRGVSDKKIKVIRNGIDLDRITGDIKNNSIRASLSIASNSLLLGVVGRLVRVKGHNYLFYCLKKMLDSGYHVTLLVLGDGSLEEEYKKLIQQIGISDYVRFLGFVENSLHYIASFDLLVMPSLNEGIPMSLLEAMAMGVPVIASRVGGIPEVIEDESTGILVEPKNVEELYQACARLASDERLRKKIASNAMKHIRTKYSSVKSAQNTLQLYFRS